MLVGGCVGGLLLVSPWAEGAKGKGVVHRPGAGPASLSSSKHAGVRAQGHGPVKVHGAAGGRGTVAAVHGPVRGHVSARGASASSSGETVYAPPLVPQRPLPAMSGRSQSSDALTGSQEGQSALSAADAARVDPASLRSVAQQLAQGGTALQFPEALQRFFKALRQRELEPGNGTVRVLQFGDSHTAADMFTGEARARMQGRFGDGGIGFSYAGHPFAGYRILGSGRGEAGAWTTLGTHFTQLGDGLLGMGGVAIQSGRAGDVASLDVPCLTMEVQYLRQPGGGSFELADNGQPVEEVSTSIDGSAERSDAAGTGNMPATSPMVGTQADAPADEESVDTVADSGAAPGQAATRGLDSPGRTRVMAGEDAADGGAVGKVTAAGSAGTLHYDCQAGSHHFTLTSRGSGPVRLLGTVALQPGITWEAIGINGAEAPLLLRWNQALFQSYLAAAAPDLIVLAYGTNEAAARWTGEEYRNTFGRLIDSLHRTVPGASILVLGPGDRSLGNTFYTTIGRGRHKRQMAHRSYVPFRGTDRILNAQREVCRTHECAFWDWKERQGGLGSMNRWAVAGYAQPDHTHLTGTGYHALADALVADLLSAYSGFASQIEGAGA